MELLLPIMLGDSRAASGLPHLFRDAYGRAALPYLRQARSVARGRFTREHEVEDLKALEEGRAPWRRPPATLGRRARRRPTPRSRHRGGWIANGTGACRSS
jgi:hypothetical protein